MNRFAVNRFAMNMYLIDHRSVNYGTNFTSILQDLDSPSPSLWSDFFVSPVNNQLVSECGVCVICVHA